MIQFSIQKDLIKIGNQISINHKEGLFDNLPFVLQFIKDNKKEELEKKLTNAIQLIPFEDGTVYVLNTIGRNYRLKKEQKEELIERGKNKGFIYEENKSSFYRFLKYLKNEIFDLYVVPVPEEELNYEIIADINNEKLLIHWKENKQHSIPFAVIYQADVDDLCYELYKKHLAIPIN